MHPRCLASFLHQKKGLFVVSSSHFLANLIDATILAADEVAGQTQHGSEGKINHYTDGRCTSGVNPIGGLDAENFVLHESCNQNQYQLFVRAVQL